MNYHELITTVSQVHQAAQRSAVGAVNRYLILRNWLIGAYLVEFEQRGEDRARYGAGLIQSIARDLKSRELGGLGASMLRDCRTFYRLYPQIYQSAIGELSGGTPIHQSLIGEFAGSAKSPLPPEKSARQPAPLPARMVLCLSWTHLIEFVRLDDPWKRAFYENECLKANWSVRQLQRQIGSLLYDRTALSTDKEAVINHARQQAVEAPQLIADLILCTDKKETRVSYATAGLDQQLFVSRYLNVLPTEETLQRIIEQDAAVWQQQHPDDDTRKTTP